MLTWPHPTPTLQLHSITTCVQITRNVNMLTPPQPFSCVALQHVCKLQGTPTCPTPTPTLQLRSITTRVQITRNVNMPHPTPTLQLRSITTCVQITRNVNMPHPTPPFSCIALQHVCYLQGTLTPHPTPPHFKNNNPRGGGESAAHQEQHHSRIDNNCQVYQLR